MMTRDGFTFLAMGFTGERAAQFKEAYISAFNEMENRLKHGGVELEKAIYFSGLILCAPLWEGWKKWTDQK